MAFGATSKREDGVVCARGGGGYRIYIAYHDHSFLHAACELTAFDGRIDVR